MNVLVRRGVRALAAQSFHRRRTTTIRNPNSDVTSTTSIAMRAASGNFRVSTAPGHQAAGRTGERSHQAACSNEAPSVIIAETCRSAARSCSGNLKGGAADRAGHGPDRRLGRRGRFRTGDAHTPGARGRRAGGSGPDESPDRAASRRVGGDSADARRAFWSQYLAWERSIGPM